MLASRCVLMLFRHCLVCCVMLGCLVQHFLSYLNNLRVKEYCTTLHNLHHYFDRNMHVTNMFAGDGADGVKKSVSDVSHGYEALNLATLHFSFGHRSVVSVDGHTVVNCTVLWVVYHVLMYCTVLYCIL